jgi:hypothetical protein
MKTMKTNKNTKSIFLSLASTSLVIGLSVQPASAQQQGHSARFNFAPNYYRLEQANVPTVSYHPTPHSVRNGHVPSSKSILGLDPALLPSVPHIQTQTQATLTQATPTHYKESFGAPANAPVMAALPATALNLPKSNDKALSVNKAVSAHLMNKKVAGRLIKKHVAGNSGQALALGQAASYGKNFGYESGPTNPSAYGNGYSVDTAVSGRLLHHK